MGRGKKGRVVGKNQIKPERLERDKRKYGQELKQLKRDEMVKQAKIPFREGQGVGKIIKTTIVETPLGEMIAGATDDGLCILEFAGREKGNAGLNDLTKLLKSSSKVGENKYLKTLRKQLKEYFAGERKEFTVPLIMPGTEFQQSVWRELIKVPFGSTKSYLEQAIAIKKPRSVRAVANVNGMNRISIIIPCHRIIGSDGSLTGYGGGLERKKWLLEHEKKYSGKAVEMSLF